MDITDQIHRYLTSAPTSHFLGQPVEMLAHWSGQEHLLWRVICRGQEAVLKLYLDAGQARSRRQFDGQQMFAPYGIAPQPLWYDRYPEGLSRQVLVYTWAPGEPLARKESEPTGSTLAALAHAIAQVHSADPADVRRFCPHPLNLDYFWRVLAGGLAPVRHWLAGQPVQGVAVLLDTLAAKAALLVEHAPAQWREAPPTPVHGDLRLENAVAGGGAVVLLDWEMFGLGDPALEIAKFLHRDQNKLDETAQQVWLDRYFADLNGAPGLAQRIALYRRLLPFQDVCFLLNGLAAYSGGGPEAAELKANLPDLTATLAAALQQATTALEVEKNNIDIDAMVHDLLKSYV